MLGSDISYFVQKHSDSTKKFSETDIINMLEFLINNIFAMFGGRVFQAVLLFSPTCSFIRMRQTSYRGFSRINEKKLARSFKFMFHYINDVLSLNNSRFGDFVDRIFPI